MLQLLRIWACFYKHGPFSTLYTSFTVIISLYPSLNFLFLSKLFLHTSLSCAHNKTHLHFSLTLICLLCLVLCVSLSFSFLCLYFFCIRLGQREALRGLDGQCGGMLPTLRGTHAQPASKWLQCLGHLALTPDATNHPLLHHLPRPNQPHACR